MTTTSRRGFIGALAASGATLTATGLSANPAKLDLGQLKKDTDVACLYHCDFGDQQRILEDDLFQRVRGMLIGANAAGGPQKLKGTITEEYLNQVPREEWYR